MSLWGTGNTNRDEDMSSLSALRGVPKGRLANNCFFHLFFQFVFKNISTRIVPSGRLANNFVFIFFIFFIFFSFFPICFQKHQYAHRAIWSPCGGFFATLGHDKCVYVFKVICFLHVFFLFSPILLLM